MMASQMFREIAELVALGLLSLAFLASVVRVIIGPTLPDRVLALDLLVSAAIGFIAVIGIRTGYTLYVDIAIALGLVGFLATVAFARFIQREQAPSQETPAQKLEDAAPVVEEKAETGT